LLLLGGYLVGNFLGKDGAGLLAKVTFGYLSDDYMKPYIVFDNKPHETKLLDSDGHIIPIGEKTLLELRIYKAMS
jgi:hypothetical protein